MNAWKLGDHRAQVIRHPRLRISQHRPSEVGTTGLDTEIGASVARRRNNRGAAAATRNDDHRSHRADCDQYKHAKRDRELGVHTPQSHSTHRSEKQCSRAHVGRT